VLDVPHELLDKLVGTWELTGQMGETAVQQAVEARWTLGGHFAEVRCRSVLNKPAGHEPYEAVYYIGFDAEDERYVMHLLDTFGARYSRFLGIGERRGNRISFVFEYPDGPFANAFTWHPDTAEWTFALTFLEDGIKRTFATKRMRRA
jgi:Protein of unknown function (DUF1579)